jgi:hypothetical protein
MRVSFNEIFDTSNDRIAVRCPINVGGITMTPGISFSKGMSFSGIDLFQYIGKDVEIEKNNNGVVEIKGFYN